jgi:Domain of unknown function DUF302
MMLRANQLNFKHVGTNQMWKDFNVVLEDKEAPKIEVFSFCDIAVGRDLLKVSPEFIVFLPCRIAVMEDGDKNIWVLMLDWGHLARRLPPAHGHPRRTLRRRPGHPFQDGRNHARRGQWGTVGGL